MQDGDVDYSSYSPRQLVTALLDLSSERFPRDHANAWAVLRAKWPEAPADLEAVDWKKIPDERIPPEPLAGGATRFQVRFNSRVNLVPGETWPNNLGLAGAGTATVDAAQLVLEQTPLRPRSAPGAVAPPANPALVFRLDELDNVLPRPADDAIVLGDRGARREVALWLQTPDDTQALLRMLPAVTTREFVEQQARTRVFSAHLRALPRGMPVTRTVIGINIAVFALLLLAGAGLMTPNPAVLIAFGANFGPLTWHGEPWRLLTAAFMHFGVIHLAVNMYSFHNGGAFIERLFGRGRFALIYLLAAVAGNVVSSWWEPRGVAAGASGAIFGVYGALLAFFLVRRAEIPARTLKVVGKGAALLCVYALAFGAVVPFVDNSAHIGGLVAGGVSGALLARPLDPAARALTQPWRVLAVGLAVCLVLALVASGVESPRLSDLQ
jgi:membrane associated rhomboid family serine protease